MAQHKDMQGTDLHISKLTRGAGSPVGVVTPTVAGEMYFDTTNKNLWNATGLTSSDWESGDSEHKAEDVTAHGATAARTASKILLRDSGGYAPANGLSFPASQVSSADANTLDDYEEGTWTATFGATIADGTHTYQCQEGSYTKIGDVVTAWCNVYINIKDVAMSGGVIVRGLPFTSKSGNIPTVATLGYISNIAFDASKILIAGISAGWNYIRLREAQTNTTPADLDASAIKNSSQLCLVAIFKV